MCFGPLVRREGVEGVERMEGVLQDPTCRTEEKGKDLVVCIPEGTSFGRDSDSYSHLRRSNPRR